MSADWQIDDLALCIKEDEWVPCDDNAIPPGARLPVRGCIYRVKVVVRMLAETFLNLEECEDDGAFCASRFRKIRPDERSGEREDWNLLVEQFGRKVKEPSHA